MTETPGPGGNQTIRFLLNGCVHEATGVEPTTTVLDYLRETLALTGTKEGCAEGDCGACMVAVADLDEADRLRLRTFNSCLQFLPTLDGKALFTVESLQAPGGRLHPVQQALVDRHGSQCGFCTPGFVMSLFALYKNEASPDRARIDDALSGNLCRCTGYRPIIAAAGLMYEHGRTLSPEKMDWLTACAGVEVPAAGLPGEAELVTRLTRLRHGGPLTLDGDTRFLAPDTLHDLADLVQANPSATLLAGGTDIGVWVNKQQREMATIIYLGNVRALQRVAVTATHIVIGAAVSLTDAFAALVKHYPDLQPVFRRFGSPAIRNAGTLVGNIANASPVGDTMPALICLAGTLVIRAGERVREMPLEAFYAGPGATALAAGEFIEAVRVPRERPDGVLRSYKVARRYDQDISTVCGAFWLDLADDNVRDARICFGGMAATPRRAYHCEDALRGHPWNEAAVGAAAAALDQDYRPISDLRGTSQYRGTVARNLLWRLYHETLADGGAVGRAGDLP